MDELTKSCKCGSEMQQVIGFDDKNSPFRQGWYCPECKAWDKAILRERNVK